VRKRKKMSSWKYTDVNSLDEVYDTAPKAYLVNWSPAGAANNEHSTGSIINLRVKFRFWVSIFPAYEPLPEVAPEMDVPCSHLRVTCAYFTAAGGGGFTSPQPTFNTLFDDPSNTLSFFDISEEPTSQVLFDRSFTFDPYIFQTNELGEKVAALNKTTDYWSFETCLQNIPSTFDGSSMTDGGISVYMQSTLSPGGIIPFPFRRHVVKMSVRTYFADN
jgi:hypothetical protein